ncbi:HD domain-containing protein [Candidatus Woesearchaeota archaeon]|nr:HD domain-containing protein [Candidatus Woesearchaeota archaeon]
MIITHPVHGSVEFNDLLTSLINTPEINRLKRINQLGMVSLVFPGGTHSRFLHAIGVCFLAGKIADHLGLPKEEKDTIQAAALLHDVGHGPFSHMLDILRPRSKDHEVIAKDIILGRYTMSIPGSGKIPSIFKKYNIDSTAVAKLINGEYKEKPYLQQIINGPVDADKLDYLLTDSHFTGAKIGVIDTDRIISVMVLEDNHLKFLEKGKPIIKAIRSARRNMLAEVYIHHTARITEKMMLKAVELSGIKEFYDFDDSMLISLLLTSESEKARDLVARILYNCNPLNPKNNYLQRNLYKVAFQIPSTSMTKKKLNILKKLRKIGNSRIEKALSKRSGLEKGDILVDFPEIYPIYSDSDFSRLKIEFKKDKKGKTNYSCFSVYCARENLIEVNKTVKELVKKASQINLNSSWINRF